MKAPGTRMAAAPLPSTAEKCAALSANVRSPGPAFSAAAMPVSRVPGSPSTSPWTRAATPAAVESDCVHEDVEVMVGKPTIRCAAASHTFKRRQHTISNGCNEVVLRAWSSGIAAITSGNR